MQLEEKLANYILDNHNITKVNYTHIYLKDATVTKKKFILNHLKAKHLQLAECLDFLDFSKTEQNKILEETFGMISKFVRNNLIKQYSSNDMLESPIDRDNFIPLLDITTSDMLLFNKKTNSVSEMSYAAWERKLSKEKKELIHILIKDSVLVYDPYHLETLTLTKWEGMEVLKVNTYSPPAWRLLPPPLEKITECPASIWKVLNHLFPDKDCLDFILNWLHIALLGRNETFLVLNGRKGIGKGVFSSILSILVGQEHFSEAPDSLLTSHFNSILDKKRVVVMDEFKVGKSEHSKLKRYINKYQNIEKKGIDADKAQEIYNSYIISNNDVTDMYLEPDDRRFSVPDLTPKNLEEVMSKKEISALVKQMEEDEGLAYDFGHFILSQGKKKGLDAFSVWKGSRFWDLCYSSLTEWKKFLVDKITSKEESTYYIASLRKEFKKDVYGKSTQIPKNIQRIKDFLNNYSHLGKYTLGVVEKANGVYIIKPEEYWRSEEESETSDSRGEDSFEEGTAERETGGRGASGEDADFL